jgi:prophage regulatory protein
MRFLRLKDLIEHTGMSKSYLYQKIASGEFPPPVKLGRSSVWILDEVEQVMALWVARTSREEIKACIERLVAERSQSEAA